MSGSKKKNPKPNLFIEVKDFEQEHSDCQDAPFKN